MCTEGGMEPKAVVICGRLIRCGQCCGWGRLVGRLVVSGHSAVGLVELGCRARRGLPPVLTPTPSTGQLIAGQLECAELKKH